MNRDPEGHIVHPHFVVCVECYCFTGDWLFLVVPFLKESRPVVSKNTSLSSEGAGWLSMFPNVHWFILLNLVISYLTYFSLCGFLQWHFYTKRRNRVS